MFSGHLPTAERLATEEIVLGALCERLGVATLAGRWLMFQETSPFPISCLDASKAGIAAECRSETNI